MSRTRKDGTCRRQVALLLPWVALLLLAGLCAVEYSYLSHFQAELASKNSDVNAKKSNAKDRVDIKTTLPSPVPERNSIPAPATSIGDLDQKNMSMPFKLHPNLHKFVMMTYKKERAKSFGQAMTEAEHSHKGKREGKGEAAIAHLEGEHGGEWDW
jgi:hypothetical protein